MNPPRPMFEQGDVAEFHYLWHHEAQKGEESGRKPRPVCIVIKTLGNPDVVFLFPFTSKPPLAGQLAMSVPETECRRIGLAAPCWIILDEYNRVEMDKDYDFVSTEPIGSVSAAFLREIASTIKQAARRIAVRAVNRT
ncbi:type II toxin-antitoxin system PemK/MazF family toxin [Nitratireductor thuwali]